MGYESVETALERRHEHILDAATTCLAEDPTATLDTIARRAGVGKATLHRHFTGRDDLILSLGYRAVELTEEVVMRHVTIRPVRVALTGILEDLTELGDRLGCLMVQPVIDTDTELEGAFARALQPLHELIGHGIAAGDVRSDLPIDWMIQHLIFAVYGAWDAVHAGALAPRDARRLVTTTVVEGITGHGHHDQGR